MIQHITKPFKEFFKLEASSGIMLLLAAVLALVISNGSYSDDYFSILKISSYPSSNLSIYTRTGSLQYSKRNYQNTWPSDIRGQQLPEGSYYFMLDLENDGRIDHQGWIYLTR